MPPKNKKNKHQKKNKTQTTPHMSIVKPMRIPYFSLLVTSLIGGMLGGFGYNYFNPQEPIEVPVIEQPQEPQPVAKEIIPSDLIDSKKNVNISLLHESTVQIYKASKVTTSPAVKQHTSENFISFGTVLTSDGWIATHTKLPSKNFTIVDSKGNAYKVASEIITDTNTGTIFFKIDANNLNVQPFKDYLSNSELDHVYSLLSGNEIFENTISHTFAVEQENPDNVIFNSDTFYHAIKTQNEFPKNAIGGPIFSQNGDIIGLLKDERTITPFNFIQPALKFVFKNEKIQQNKLGVQQMIDLSLINYKIEDTHIPNGALVYKTKVSGITKNSPAEKAGLQDNDIILKIDNDTISEQKSLPFLLSEYPLNSKITATILRDGLEKEIEIQL